MIGQKLSIALFLSLALILAALAWSPKSGAQSPYIFPGDVPGALKSYSHPEQSCTTRSTFLRRKLKFRFVMYGIANRQSFSVRQIRYRLTPNSPIRLSRKNKISIYYLDNRNRKRELYSDRAIRRNNKWQRVRTYFPLPRNTQLYWQPSFDIPFARDVSCRPQSLVIGRLPARR
jgi:hypothetical protein